MSSRHKEHGPGFYNEDTSFGRTPEEQTVIRRRESIIKFGGIITEVLNELKEVYFDNDLKYYHFKDMFQNSWTIFHLSLPENESGSLEPHIVRDVEVNIGYGEDDVVTHLKCSVILSKDGRRGILEVRPDKESLRTALHILCEWKKEQDQ